MKKDCCEEVAHIVRNEILGARRALKRAVIALSLGDSKKVLENITGADNFLDVIDKGLGNLTKLARTVNEKEDL